MTMPRFKSISHILLFFVLLASLLGSAVFVTPAYAAGMTVNSSADDTIAGDGFCTLREALANANGNSDTTSGDCVAGSGDDTITFAPGLSGQTIHLGSTLTLSSNITIDGSALSSQITISGDGNVQVFSVSSGTVILDSLTITNGSVSDITGGGGIYNQSGTTLTITNSTLSGNTNTGGPGGGIRNDGTLTVTNSTFSNNVANGPGGGIRNDGTLTVTNSTFSDNSAGLSGGGIRNIGALIVANSTFSSNIAVTGSGGGIYNPSGFISVTITNSTFSGNQAGSQGGGIYFDGGTLNYANTIIANSVSGGDCAGSGAIGTNTNNLVEDGGCSAALSGNPGLDSLANNGGPTQTIALISGSQTIDAGDDTTCTNSPVSGLDQRGVARPSGACDIGAYEGSVPDIVAPSVSAFAATSPSTSLNIPITSFDATDNANITGYLITELATQPLAGDSGWTGSAPSTYTVSSVGDYTLYPWAKDATGNVSSVYGSPAAVTVCNASTTVTSNADSGAGTLRQAISDTCPGGTITFYVALSGTTIHLASTLTLAKNMTIDGSALSGQITISGDNAVRVFSVNSGVTATMNSLAITNGSNFSGGGIRNDGTLTITNSTLSDNSATSGGGGIFNTGGGTLTITNSTLSSNSAASGGGGIHNQGMLTVTNSTLSGNSAASSFGGGIYNNGGTLNFANAIIANSAGGDCINGGTGTIGTNTNNLIEDIAANACGLTDGVNSNIIGTDPNLGSLADNGGPTQTFALLTGSLAINAGDNTTCAASPVNNLDQRGVTRPQGGQCDIGAYEYEATVTSNADSGAGTLRQAIADAASGDTILFDSSLSGATIHLASTLNIVQNMTIDGSALASKITVSGDSDSDGSGDVRVFYIHSGMTVTIDSLIITKGNGTSANMEDSTTGGGGIQNNSGNTSGVVLTVKNSIISGNSADTGGGIYNRDQSTITITNSTISSNTASGNGGGIYSDGTLTVAGSTISGNSAGGDGGGIREGSITTLTNSTISGNTATGNGGGIRNAGNLTARNNTLSNNSSTFGTGGGIYSDNVFNATNNIIANSPAGGDCTGEIDGNLNNLIEDTSANACGLPNVVNGNIIGTDPALDALADNGGSTQTLALTVGSPAIDAGDNSTCTSAPVSNLDQRGVARPVGAYCDIGAYEGAKDITAPTIDVFTPTSLSWNLNIPVPSSHFTASDDVLVAGYKITESNTPPSAGDVDWTASAPTTYTVSDFGSYTLYPWAKDAAGNVSALYGSPASVTVCFPGTITVTSNGDSGAGSLRKAIADSCEGYTIDFNASLSGSTILLNSPLSLQKNVTIDGSTLASQVSLNGSGSVGVIDVNSGATVTLDSLTITNGHASNGAGINNNGALTIRNSTISGNSASFNGGGIFNNGQFAQDLTIINSTISGNTSADVGGGIANYGGVMTIANSTISGNSASNQGGGLLLGAWNSTQGTHTLVNTTLSGNSAGTNGGGGIYEFSNGGTLNYANTIIANSSGGDCLGFISLGTNTNDLVEDGTCSASLSGDPNLGPLANNGGPTQTLALLIGSPAINAGNDVTCAASPVSNLDQRGMTRPNNGTHCDIGAYEYQDAVAPTVSSIALVNSSPTNLASVSFTVTFSESVSGVDMTDFSLTTSGVTGTSVTGVTGSGTSRTVSVNTGSGNGTIRLDALDDNSIQDAAGNPLNGPFNSGDTYTIDKTVTLTVQSTGTQDGWVLESSETSGKGGTLNSAATTFNLGDDATKKQYLGILSFSTGASLPDTAVITGVTLKVMKKGIVGGGNPVTAFKGFMVDIKNGILGTAALQAADFQAKASHSYGPFMPVPISNWYSMDLTGGSAFINKLASGSGLTQIRLRFKLDDNNNAIANYLALYSGNAPTVNRPQLVISYYVP